MINNLLTVKTKKEEIGSLDLGEGFHHCPKCGLAFNKEPMRSRHPPYGNICPDCGTEEAIKCWEVFISQKR